MGGIEKIKTHTKTNENPVDEMGYLPQEELSGETMRAYEAVATREGRLQLSEDIQSYVSDMDAVILKRFGSLQKGKEDKAFGSFYSAAKKFRKALDRARLESSHGEISEEITDRVSRYYLQVIGLYNALVDLPQQQESSITGSDLESSVQEVSRPAVVTDNKSKQHARTEEFLTENRITDADRIDDEIEAIERGLKRVVVRHSNNEDKWIKEVGETSEQGTRSQEIDVLGVLQGDALDNSKNDPEDKSVEIEQQRSNDDEEMSDTEWSLVNEKVEQNGNEILLSIYNGEKGSLYGNGEKAKSFDNVKNRILFSIAEMLGGIKSSEDRKKVTNGIYYNLVNDAFDNYAEARRSVANLYKDAREKGVDLNQIDKAKVHNELEAAETNLLLAAKKAITSAALNKRKKKGTLNSGSQTKSKVDTPTKSLEKDEIKDIDVLSLLRGGE